MGLSDHVTNAAGCLLIGTSIVLTFLVERQKIKLYSFLLFIILWALILTGSISSFIAFFFTLLFSIMRRDRNRLGAFILIFSLIIFAVYLLQKFGFYDFVGRFRSTTSGRYNTSLSRILNISTSIKSITSDLHTFFLGVGLDKDSGLVQSDNQEILQVHNSLLQIFYQGGFFFMVSIIYLTSKGVNAALKLRPQLVHKLILPCVAAIIFSFTSPLMYSRYIWFPLILCLSISELPFDNEQKNAPPGGE
jgi:hypothetical protein